MGSSSEDGGHECPTCGRTDFKSEHGMKIHHSHAHGESIARTELICEVCEETFSVQDSIADKRVTCGPECNRERRSQLHSGEGNPQWAGGDVELVCEICGDTFGARPSDADNRRTCGYTCRRELQRRENSGKNNPNWRGGSSQRPSYPPEESHTCPTCGRDDFGSERAMKIHHTHIHNESIAGVEITCKICGKTVRAPLYRAEEQKTCGAGECRGELLRQMFSGSGSPRWVKRVEQTCGICGDSYRVRVTDVNKRKTCGDLECRSEHFSQQYSGEDSSLWKGGMATLTCVICGDEFQVFQAVVDERVTCGDMDCHSEYKRRTAPRGEEHYNWKPEFTGEYGPSFPRQRRRALERDNYQCRVCSMTNQEHKDAFEQELHAHHITPFRLFGIERHEEANRLANLVILCRPHHNEWEGIPVAPQ